MSIILLLLFAVISNTSQSGLTNIDVQFFRLVCPLPLNSAVASNLNIDSNNLLTYDVAYDTSGGDYHVTTFHCSDDNTISASTTIYTTANNWFNIGIGYLFYISEVISSLVNSLKAVATLLAFVLTPINFNILGFTIGDLSGVALLAVIGLYIFCYVGIGLFLYKAILPTGGIS